MTHFILATAGHIDHGKSSLVKALTGTDPDRLPEEKQRGITIDLGFAELWLKAGDGREFSVGIVDVPGHEDFVRNMIAGVGSINVGLLIVAADDGWMPQTEEHLRIFIYLGVPRLVVAITKCDLGDHGSVARQVREELKDTPFQDAAIVLTSAISNLGLTELKDALLGTLAAAPAPPDVDKARLAVDRVFTLRGIGTVVTGTLTGGTLKTGMTVWLQPAGIQARIRSTQSHGREVSVSHPGMRTALSLPEIESGDSPKSATRGDMISAHSSSASRTLDVLLQVSGRDKSDDHVIRNNLTVDVHYGTARIRAVVRLLENSSLGAGESGLAQLRLTRPVLAFFNDRLVLRDTAQKHTLAGCVVLDPDGSRRRDRRDAQLVFLKRRATKPGELKTAILSQVERDQFVRLEDLLAKSSFSAAQIAAATRELASAAQIVMNGFFAADVSVWNKLRSRARAIIDKAHAQNPQRPGLDLSVLRSELREYLPNMVEAVISELASTEFIRRDLTIARRDHRAELPGALQATAAEILRRLSEKPFDPPALKTMAADENTRKAMRFLIDRGKVIEIDSEVILSAAAFEKMKEVIISFLSAKPGGAGASEIRLELQTSRRILIPLLEYLDRKNVTRRQGDLRILTH